MCQFRSIHSTLIEFSPYPLSPYIDLPSSFTRTPIRFLRHNPYFANAFAQLYPNGVAPSFVTFVPSVSSPIR